MALIRLPLCRSPFPLRAPVVAAALAACALFVALPGEAQQPAPGNAERRTEKLSPTGAAEGFSAELFYKFLVAEVALQRGEMSVAARAYYEAARESRTPYARTVLDKTAGR